MQALNTLAGPAGPPPPYRRGARGPHTGGWVAHGRVRLGGVRAFGVEKSASERPHRVAH